MLIITTMVNVTSLMIVNMLKKKIKKLKKLFLED